MGSLAEDLLSTDKQFLAAPIKKAVDKFPLIPEFLKVRGLVKQHLDSYNYFVNIGIKKIVRANSLIQSDDPETYIRYRNVKIGNPEVYYDLAADDITPHGCRLTDRTYAAPIKVNVEVSTRAHGKREQPDVVIGRMPVMLRSCRCVLNGKDEAELAKLGECPLDPGGYFVVKGTEKVVLIQEQLSNNRIIIDTDKKGHLVASVTSSTEKTKSKTTILMDKERIYLQLNAFAKPVPIMVVMKAMGIESDQEVVQMVGRDPRYASMLLPSIQECATENVYNQKQALDSLDKKAKKSAYSDGNQEGKALYILREVFLAHVPVRELNFRPKCIYAAVMLRRMMDAILNKDAIDDKDYVGNKRLELSGQLISLLFEDLFKTMNGETKKRMDLALKTSRAGSSNFVTFIQGDSITQGLERAMSTGNWDLKRFKMHRKGMTQVLARLSFIGSVGQMTRVKPQFEKSRKVSGPRALQPSQWGIVCPCDKQLWLFSLSGILLMINILKLEEN